MHHTIRRLLLAATLCGGAWLCLTALDGAAQAHDHHRPAIEQPGGLLDKVLRLPDQASDRARDAVTKPHRHRKPHRGHHRPGLDTRAAELQPAPAPEPTPEPTPEHTEPPTPPAGEPTTDPTPPPGEPPLIELPPVEVPPVVIDLPIDPVIELPPVEVPPVVIDLPPVEVETPPVAVEPDTSPAPAPDPIVITLPAPPKPTPPLPLPLPATPPASMPVAIGPTLSQTAPAPVIAQLIATLTAAAPDPQPAECGHRPDDAVNVNHDAIRQLIDSLITAPPAEQTHATPGCPSKPDNPANQHADCAAGTTTNSSSHTLTLNGDITDRHTTPARDRLHHARPRSHLPASRHVAVEPGPA